jgi:hypothetical protein
VSHTSPLKPAEDLVVIWDCLSESSTMSDDYPWVLGSAEDLTGSLHAVGHPHHDVSLLPAPCWGTGSLPACLVSDSWQPAYRQVVLFVHLARSGRD